MTNIPLMIGGGLFILMLIVIGWLSISNVNLKADIRTKDAQIMVFKSANDDFMKLAKKQNDEYAVLRQQAVERAKRAQRAIDDAKQKAKRYEIIVTNITNMKRSGNECEDAKRLVNTYLKANK